METSITGSVQAQRRRRQARRLYCIGGQLDDAVMILAQKQFARRAHHAARFHAADGADLQRFAGGGNDGAGPRQHHLDSGPRIGRAADDLQWILVAAIDHAQPQLVGIGMFLGA